MEKRLLTELAEFATGEDGTALDAALLVSGALDESFQGAEVLHKLARLAMDYRQQANETTPWQFLQQQGYAAAGQVDVLEGSRIDALLEHKRGLPILRGVLLIQLCEATGHAASGINFPGHFLVRVGEVLVDPFQMVETTEQDCLASLPTQVSRQGAFAVADGRAIAQRMFNNLKYHFGNIGQFHRALELLDCQLSLAPHDAGLLFEQGEFWLRLGSIQGARSAFEQALLAADTAGSSDLAALAKRRLDALADRSDTLH